MFKSQVHKSRSRSLPALPMSRRLEWLLTLTILCLAAALRLWQLDSIPPGLTHDEAGHGQDALAILNGARPVYETIGYGREPLYDYLVAAAMGLLGRTDYLVLRWVSAFFGLLTVSGTYLWSRRAFGPWEAILASGWLAVSFWGIATSRQALRSTVLPALLIAAIYTWWRGVYDDGRHRHTPLCWFAATGLILGATLWTYMAARVTWVLFLAMPLYILATDWHRFKKRWPGMVLALVLAGAVAAPLFVWLQLNPGVEQRFSQLGEPLRLIGRGDFRAAWANSTGALKMFTVEADDLWVYNVSGRPWLGLLVGLLFYVGLLLSLWRWRQPRYALALMVLCGGLVPSLITGVSACSTRAIAILPVLYVFPAIAVTTLVKRTGLRRFMLPLAIALVVTSGAQDYYDYFTVWATHREVRVAYHTTLYEISRELEGLPAASGSPTIISSIYPGQYHDPYAMELLLKRKDLSLRWVDGRGGMLFPDRVTRLIVPALAELDPVLARIVESHGYLAVSRTLAPDDLNPRFDIYEWDSSAAIEDILTGSVGQGVAWSSSNDFPVDDPEANFQMFDLPANLANTIELIGYDLTDGQVAAGSEITLVTYWRVIALPQPDLEFVLFTHVLNLNGTPAVLSQQDRLDVPAWNWSRGDVLAQVHHLTIEDDVVSGIYPVEVGAYTRPQPSPIDPDPPTARLSLLINGLAVDDRILLRPVQVRNTAVP